VFATWWHAASQQGATPTLTPTNRPKRGSYSFDARINKIGFYSFDARIKSLAEMYSKRLETLLRKV